MKSTILFSFLLFTSFIFSQSKNFEEVKTARNVINNYLNASGGKDKLKEIKIIKLEGKYYKTGEEFNISRYIGNDFYYQKWGNSEMQITTVYNENGNYGWEQYDNDVIFFTEDMLNFYNTFGINYWGKYIYSKKLYLSFSLIWNEKVDNHDAYVIEMSKDGNLLRTLYFDIKTFEILKYSKDGNEMSFIDYKEVGNTGIVMPYAMVSIDTLLVDKYEFNPEFDRNLLKKPVK